MKRGALFYVKMIFLSVFAASTIFTFCWVLLSSFKSTTEIYGNAFSLPAVWKFDNYATAWKGAGMSHSFLNSFVYTTIAVVLVLTISSMVSYVIARHRFGRYLYLFFSFVFDF